METDKPQYPILTELRANTTCETYSHLPEVKQDLLAQEISQGLGISQAHCHLTFDGRYPMIEKSLREIADPDIEGVDSCIISGPTGTGKTATLSAMFKHRFHIQALKTDCPAYVLADWVWQNVVYVSYSELCKVIRDREMEMELTWGRICKCDLLMLDDLGHGFSDQAGWNLSKVSELLDYRWNDRMKTWLTTNMSGKKYKGKPSDLEQWVGSRSFSRIGHRLWMAYFEMSGADRRGEKTLV